MLFLKLLACEVFFCSSNQFQVTANNFIEELCCQLLLWDNKRLDVHVVDLMKSVLRLSLPNISCE